MKPCTLIIPVYNQKEVTRRCLESIFKHADSKQNVNLILVDDASVPETASFLFEISKMPQKIPIRLLRFETNQGYIKSANAGLTAATTPLVCLLNNDTVVTESWLETMAAHFDRHPKIGMVTPQSTTYGLHPKRGENVEDIARQLRTKFSDHFIETAHCHGFCALIKKEVLERIGVLDEAFGRGYFDDQDFTRRVLKEGYLSVIAQDAYVWHEEHATFTTEDREKLFEKNRELFHTRWGKPKRILAVARRIKDEAHASKIAETCLGLARGGNWVWLVGPQGYSELVKETSRHANIRAHWLPRFWIPPYSAYLYLKRRKKPFDEVRSL